MAVAITAGNFDRATNPHPNLTDFEHKPIDADIGWLRHIPTMELRNLQSIWSSV